MKYNIKRIEDYIKRRKISKIEFCKICGILNSALEKVYEGRKDISMGVFYKIYENVGLCIICPVEGGRCLMCGRLGVHRH